MPRVRQGPDAAYLALGREYRWLAMVESGKFKSLKDIAKPEGGHGSFVSRSVNLTSGLRTSWRLSSTRRCRPKVTLFDVAVDPPAL